MAVNPHQRVPLSAIRTDGGTQARVQLDWLAVDEYAKAMKAGEQFPWPTLYWDGTDYWLADGFHRVAAAERAEIKELTCYVIEGNKRNALLYAVACNTAHGVRRTNADKRRAVLLLLEDKEWGKWSDSKIAHHAQVSIPTVGNIRKELSLRILEIDSPRLVERNGRTYEMNTATIGKRADAAVVEAEPEPDNIFNWTEEAAGPTEEEVEPGKSTEGHEWKKVEPESATLNGHSRVSVETLPSPHLVTTAEFTTPPPITVIHGDAQYTGDLVADPVHLVVTSPPYNVGIDYDQHNDNLTTYLPLLGNVWRGCYRTMVEGARICVVVPFGVGRAPWTPFAARIMESLQEAGFTLRGQIVWDKNTTGNRTSWGSFRMASAPALRDTTECIVVAHKGDGVLPIPSDYLCRDAKGSFTPWLADSDYFMELAQDHWVIAPESAQRVKHPAPFPIDLVSRLIHFYAFPGAHVLDPFGGSGTTGVAARRTGCAATLIDLSADYCRLAEERIANE